MTLDKGRWITGNRYAFNHVGIQSSLSKKPVVAVTGIRGFQFFRCFFENANKFAPDQLSFLLGIRDPLEKCKESLRSVDVLEPDVEIASKHLLNGFGLARPEQAVIDENAGQLRADCAMNQSSSNGRVDASRQAKHDFVVADFIANITAGLLDE